MLVGAGRAPAGVASVALFDTTRENSPRFRHSKHDKAKNSSEPSSQRNAVVLVDMVPGAPSTQEDVAGRVPMNWRVKGIDKRSKLLKEQTFLWIQCASLLDDSR